MTEKTGLTESEAMRKWCPHARSLYHSQPQQQYNPYTQYNNPYTTPYTNPGQTAPVTIQTQPAPTMGTYNRMGDCNCMASGCMAWRFFENLDDVEKRGYCGAFGPPEA